MEIIKKVSYSNYSVSAYSVKKLVAQAESGKELKKLLGEEKLEEFKKEIWNEIDSMPWGCDISIHISDDAFKRMLNDNEFKDKMLSKIREDASVSRIKGGGTILNIDESGYSGFSWMEGYVKEGSAGVKAHSKGSFYYKMASHKQDYMELWEERRHKREIQRERLDEAYEEQLYRKQYWARKERASAAYESNFLQAILQR